MYDILFLVGDIMNIFAFNYFFTEEKYDKLKNLSVKQIIKLNTIKDSIKWDIIKKSIDKDNVKQVLEETNYDPLIIEKCISDDLYLYLLGDEEIKDTFFNKSKNNISKKVKKKLNY